MNKYLKIIMCLWLLIIFLFVFSQEYILLTGREVLLKTIPIDPRDLMRGDYVILNYEIAQLGRYQKNRYYDNQTVYLTLSVDNKNIAHRNRIEKEPPKDRKLYIKGQIRNGSFNPSVQFGIESYFVKEGTGRKLERDLANGALVRVMIDKKGSAKVKGFVLD